MSVKGQQRLIDDVHVMSACLSTSEYRCVAANDVQGHYRKSRPRYITDETISLA